MLVWVKVLYVLARMDTNNDWPIITFPTDLSIGYWRMRRVEG